MYYNDSTTSGIKNFQIQWESAHTVYTKYIEQAKKIKILEADIIRKDNIISWLQQDIDLCFDYINDLENDVAAYKQELDNTADQLERLANKCRC